MLERLFKTANLVTVQAITSMRYGACTNVKCKTETNVYFPAGLLSVEQVINAES